MDYHSMKRRELQALCKKHNIPANSANSVMADKLSQLLNEKQKPRARQRTCLKSSVETNDESEPAVSRREAKKVRFSPTNELVEYELRSAKKQEMVKETKSRRKSVAKKVVDNVNTVDLTDEVVQIPVKLTRSRVHNMEKEGAIPVTEKKQSKRGVKNDEKETEAVKETEVVKETEANRGRVTRSKEKGGGVSATLNENKQSKKTVEDVEKKPSEPVKENVVARGRVTRSKVQTLTEDLMVPDLNSEVKKKSSKQVTKDVENVESVKENTEIPVRATRSRGKTLKDDSSATVSNLQDVKKRSRKDMIVASEVDQELPKRKLSRTKGVDVANESENMEQGKRKTRSQERKDEVLEGQLQVDNGSRQTRRNKAKVEDSKVEIVNERRTTRSKASSTMEPSKDEQPLEQKGKKKVTRRKSVKAKETEIVGSPSIGTRKTVGRKQSKVQSGKLVAVKENVTESIKDDFDDEIRNPKSRKRRGDPIVEDLTVETDYVSPVKETPKHATRSADKSEVKSVSKKKESSLRASASTIGDSSIKRAKISGKRSQSDSEDNGEKSNPTDYVSPVKESPKRATRSADKNEVKSVAKKKESSLKASASRIGSSKKRAKLSEKRKSDLEEHVGKSSEKGMTPVSKMGSLELDEKVNETELTPTVDESGKRFTRSAIRSEIKAVGSSRGKVVRKKTAQSAIKERPTGDSQLSSRTAPGRFTRSGMKSHNELEVLPNSDVDTIRVQSEAFKEDKGQNVEQSAELPPSDSVILEAELDEKVNQTESGKRFTRSAIRSEIKAMGSSRGKVVRKKTTQSAIKERPTEDSQLSSRTAPGRFTRSGMKSHNELAVLPSSDVDTIRVQSEVFKEDKGQNVEQSAELPPSDSVILEAEVAEENVVPTSETHVMENVNSVNEKSFNQSQSTPDVSEQGTSGKPYLIENLFSEKQQSAVKLQNLEVETPSRTSLSDIKETPNADSEDNTIHIEDLSNKSSPSETSCMIKNLFSEDQKSPVDLPRFDDETPLKTNVSDAKKSPSDALFDESLVQDHNQEKALNTENPVLKSADSEGFEKKFNVRHVSFEESDIKSMSKEIEAPLEPVITEDAHAQNSSVGKHDASDINELDDDNEDENATPQKQLNNESVFEDNRADDDAQDKDSVVAEFGVESDEDDSLGQTTGGGKSGRKFTRSAIRSEKKALGKKPSHSAFNEQLYGDSEVFSRTAPGRFTRSGNAASQSATIQPLNDSEVLHSSDADTIAVQSEVFKEDKCQNLERSTELPPSDSVILGTSIVMENVDSVNEKSKASDTPYLIEKLFSGEQQSPVDLPNSEDETSFDAKKTLNDALFDESHAQDPSQEEAVYMENSVVKSADLEVFEKEIEVTKFASTSNGLQIAVKGSNVDADDKLDSAGYEAGFSAVRHVSFDQSNLKSKSKEIEAPLEPLITEDRHAQFSSEDKHDASDNDELDEDEDENVTPQKQLLNEPVFEDKENDSVVAECGIESNKDDTLNPSTCGDKSVRRLTRSAIRSEINEIHRKADMKKLSQSAIKDAKFRPDSVLNTAPGRFTRTGIIYRGNAESQLNEKVDDEKKESSQSAIKQLLNDSEVEHLPASDSVISATLNASKHEMSATPDMIETLFNEKQKSPEDETPSGKNLSDVKESLNAAKSETSETPSMIKNLFSQDETPSKINPLYAPNLNHGVALYMLKSVFSEVYEKEKNSVAYEAGSSANRHVSFQQSDIKGKSKEVEQFIDDYGGFGQIEKVSEPSNDENALEDNYDFNMAKDDAEDDDVDMPKELGHGLEAINDENVLEVPLTGNDVDKEQREDAELATDNEQTTEEVDELATENDDEAASVKNKQRTEEAEVASDNDDDALPEISDHLMENTEAFGSPNLYKKEGSPADNTVSDPPTSLKDKDSNKQETTQNATSSLDWGNYSFGIIDESMKDDQDSDLQASARATTSSMLESSTPAVDLVKSVTNLDEAFRNTPKESANANEELFNWSDSFKAIFDTPAPTQSYPQWENESSRVPNFEDYFGDGEVNGSCDRSAENKHSEFNENASPSGFKDDSLRSEDSGKKEEK